MTMKQDQVARVASANKGAPVSEGWSLPHYQQRVVAGEGGGLVSLSCIPGQGRINTKCL